MVQHFDVPSFGVCRVEGLDVPIALSREEKKDTVLIRPVVANYNHMEVEKGKS
jgi:hypothetical protein